MEFTILFSGFPGRSDRGFLGWSSCVLFRDQGRPPVLYDTAGFNERYVLLQKLRSIGIEPTDIGTVLLSHFHFDHAVNYPLFPNAHFYMHQEEIRHIERNGQVDLAVPYEMYDALQKTGRLRVLSGEEGEVDGIRWLHTPGHTPGLYSLLLNYRQEMWAFVSDTVKNEEELRSGEIAMAWDLEQSKESIRKIREQADVILPGHDRLIRIRPTIRAIEGCEVEIATPNQTYRLERR